MTLIIAIKYKNGSVLASDSRVMLGELKLDKSIKLEPLTDNIGIASSGLIGAIDDIIKRCQSYVSATQSPTFEEVVSNLSDSSLSWHKSNAEKLDDDDDLPAFIVASPERIRKIMGKGYSEEEHGYACDGSGRAYGEYILNNHFREGLDGKDAKELAVYTILETSKMDPSVGGDIQLLVFPRDEKCKIIGTDEIEEIKAHQAPLSKDVMDTYTKTVKNIVNLRDNINNLWEQKYGFKVLLQNEKAVFEITKICRSEMDFTHNIEALALLVDQLNVKKMKEISPEREGSINILEDFLTKKIKKFPPDIISNLRDIMVMRSKSFPTHTTDPKFG